MAACLGLSQREFSHCESLLLEAGDSSGTQSKETSAVVSRYQVTANLDSNRLRTLDCL
jgi:hypothetical protein